jgi:hypothetical protein
MLAQRFEPNSSVLCSLDYFCYVMLCWFLKELNVEICVGLHGILERYCVHWLFSLGESSHI